MGEYEIFEFEEDINEKVVFLNTTEDTKSITLPIPETKNNIPNIKMNIMIMIIKNIITNKSTF